MSDRTFLHLVREICLDFREPCRYCAPCQTQKEWADRNSTSGTYRPCGLDCSGFVDWVFYNATGGAYYPGHGGGATMQHNDCAPIAWTDAQPGDLVFYPDDSHVGIVGGRDEDGALHIIHCASNANGTVITGVGGFMNVGKPVYYSSYIPSRRAHRKAAR